jgi:hypothetical protein
LANPVIDAHFARLQQRYPNAALTYLKSGAALVTLPDRPLLAGWSASAVTLRIVAPATYSVAAPDCFWIEPNLSLAAGGGLPQNSELNREIPDTTLRGHWFSWHVAQGHWSPNEHDLLTWVTSCMDRLSKVQ